MGDLCSLEELEAQLLVVELHGEDGAWRGPGANHEVMEGHFGMTSVVSVRELGRGRKLERDCRWNCSSG